MEEIKFKNMRRFNLIMGFMHLIQGVLMVFFSNDRTYPIFTIFSNLIPIPSHSCQTQN